MRNSNVHICFFLWKLWTQLFSGQKFIFLFFGSAYRNFFRWVFHFCRPWVLFKGSAGHFGSFWVIFGHFGSFWSFGVILGDFGSFWSFLVILVIFGHFGSFWVILVIFDLNWPKTRIWPYFPPTGPDFQNSSTTVLAKKPLVCYADDTFFGGLITQHGATPTTLIPHGQPQFLCPQRCGT